jgi:hypothetical protein
MDHIVASCQRRTRMEFEHAHFSEKVTKCNSFKLTIRMNRALA